MCTAVSYNNGNHYFGRNLDVEMSYGEEIVITPRNYLLKLKNGDSISGKYAIIGVAKVVDNFPLYFDGTNEKGLGIAALNFPKNAFYNKVEKGKKNITPFEFIPYILAKCQNISEVKNELENVNMTSVAFSDDLPLTPLHWMISDRTSSMTVEQVKEGLKVYDNPVGVLTNNPPFDMQMTNLNNYVNLSASPPKNNFSGDIEFDIYSYGMGAIGLPGDLSSPSRFVKAVFTKYNSVVNKEEALGQFFHILSSVCQQKGCTHLGEGRYEYTSYSTCYDTEKGLMYYTTYENSRISVIDMHRENLEEGKIKRFPLLRQQSIFKQNIS